MLSEDILDLLFQELQIQNPLLHKQKESLDNAKAAYDEAHSNYHCNKHTYNLILNILEYNNYDIQEYTEFPDED